MRAHPFAWFAAGLAVLAALPAAAPGQQVTPAQLLKFRPVQKELAVDFDTPATPEEAAACKTETKSDPQTKMFAYILRDPQGRLLRRFSGQTQLNQWSYFKDGFEVYREVDTNEDKYADECRWLNAGGTKIALLKDNAVVGWKRISAEEASRVLVQAVVTKNAALLATILATPEELAELGAPKAEQDRQAKLRGDLDGALAALSKTVTGWDDKTAWQRFDGSMPHVLPADAGLKDDVILYENAFVFAGSAGADPMKTSYLQVPELIQVGPSWKMVGMPRAVNPSDTVASGAPEGGLRAALFQVTTGGAAAAAANPKLEEALQALAQHDQKAPSFDASKQDLAAFHYNRVKLLDAVVKAAGTDEDRTNYTRQVIDSLAAAYQTGLFAAGAGVLEKYAGQPDPIGPYAGYRTILAEYAIDADQPGSDYMQVQKKFLGKLEGFLEKYPKAAEVPDVLFQLASINEFNADEDKARTFYGRLAADHGDTEAGKKAAGAVKRLDLVGKTISVSGAGLTGGTVGTDQFAGKTLLVAFWTTTADPVRKDLPELVKVYEKYKSKGFQIIGVCLDADKATLEAFLKENPLPWPQVYEPGGMDSRLANELGIISLPTMILADGSGKVVSRNVRNAADLDRYLERQFTAATASSAIPGLGEKR
jgi:thiol-disulfide isomerase/thioredoxin